MKDFFYKNWILYYILFFLLLGLLIYALLWNPICPNYQQNINDLKQRLEECQNRESTDSTAVVIDSSSVKNEIVDCDATVKSGGKGTTETTHQLGQNSGKVVIKYNMQNIPDQMIVYYNNEIVAQTDGLVSGLGTLEFEYNPSGSNYNCKIIVDAPQDKTNWEYIVNCPN